MLKLDLLVLRRERALPVCGKIPPEAPLWNGTGLRWSGPVEVEARGSLTPDGGVIINGTLRGTAVYQCGRCLEAVSFAHEHHLVLVFMSEGEWDSEDDVRTLEKNDRYLDLTEIIREEVMLAFPRYYVHPPVGGQPCASSSDEAEGLEDSAPREIDPRWSTLATLKEQREGR